VTSKDVLARGLRNLAAEPPVGHTDKLLLEAAEALEHEHYASIEHEHLGCHVAKNGIYAERTIGPKLPVEPTMGMWDDFCMVHQIPFNDFLSGYRAMVRGLPTSTATQQRTLAEAMPDTNADGSYTYRPKK
jgi:hypothetical protein